MKTAEIHIGSKGISLMRYGGLFSAAVCACAPVNGNVALVFDDFYHLSCSLK